MKTIECDLAVIGAGTAGLVAAGVGASLGARTILIERENIGGECLWTGCVPSKTLIQSAKVFDTVNRAAEFGVHVESPKVRWNAITLRIAAVRDEIRGHEREQLKELGLEPLRGEARFENAKTLLVESKDGPQRISARKFILSAGTKIRIPQIDGLEETGYLTHENLYDLPALPRSLIFIGGGPVACEFAHCFARLGTRVTLIQKNARLLDREDEDVSEAALKILRSAGVEVHLSATPTEAGRDEKGAWVRLADEKLRASKLVVATGKVCDLTGLSAEAAGISWDAAGVKVDAHLRAVANVWACGDVTGAPYFTHRSEYQGRIAAQNALLPVHARTSEQALPRVTYLDPEIASVGVAEAEAVTGGARIYKVPFATLDRAIIAGEETGFCKIIVSPAGRILGASIVGSNAGELIALLAMCVRDGVLIQELGEAVFAYPTLSEIAHRAGQQYFRDLLNEPLVKKVARRLTRRG